MFSDMALPYEVMLRKGTQAERISGSVDYDTEIVSGYQPWDEA
jgi:hypothetical protein